MERHGCGQAPGGDAAQTPDGKRSADPYKTIVAFSGEHKYNGAEPALTSAGLNGFPDAKIPKEFKKDPYRILIVADMFQTGFDEPLLQTRNPFYN